MLMKNHEGGAADDDDHNEIISMRQKANISIFHQCIKKEQFLDQNFIC